MTKDQDRVYKESGILFSLPEILGSASSHAGVPFRLCKAVIITKSSHQFETLVFTISRHTCTKCRKVILAYSEQLKLWTAFSPCLYQLVQARWTVLLVGDTLFQILSSKWRHPDRTYANMVANVVCVSLHHRTHGEGEGLMASSPAEPVGRR